MELNVPAWRGVHGLSEKQFKLFARRFLHGPYSLLQLLLTLCTKPQLMSTLQDSIKGNSTIKEAVVARLQELLLQHQDYLQPRVAHLNETRAHVMTHTHLLELMLVSFADEPSDTAQKVMKSTNAVCVLWQTVLCGNPQLVAVKHKLHKDLLKKRAFARCLIPKAHSLSQMQRKDPRPSQRYYEVEHLVLLGQYTPSVSLLIGAFGGGYRCCREFVVPLKDKAIELHPGYQQDEAEFKQTIQFIQRGIRELETTLSQIQAIAWKPFPEKSEESQQLYTTMMSKDTGHHWRRAFLYRCISFLAEHGTKDAVLAIRLSMIAHDFSAHVLANKLGVPEDVLKKWVTTGNLPGQIMIKQIARELRIDLPGIVNPGKASVPRSERRRGR